MRLLNIIDREKNDNKKRVYNRKRVCDQKLLFLLKEVHNLLICRALKCHGKTIEILTELYIHFLDCAQFIF